MEPLFADRHSKAERTQLRIVEASVDLFVKKGFYETSYDDIAKAAKVSRPLVLHYFPARSDLFGFSVRYIRSHMLQLALSFMKPAQSTTAKLELYVQSTFHWVKKYPSHARFWLLFYFYASFREEDRRLNTQLVTQGHERIMGILKEGAERKEFQVRDFEGTAKAIQNLITGSLLSVLTEDRSQWRNLERDRVTAVCLKLIERKK